MSAIETPHHSGPPWSVGKAFAKLCRPEHEMDIDVIMAGAIEFVATGVGVVEYVKTRKSMEGGEVIQLSEK
jgi:hypothetical protein